MAATQISSIRYHLKKVGYSASNQEIEQYLHTYPDLSPDEIAKKMTQSLSTENTTGQLTKVETSKIVTKEVAKLQLQEDESTNLIIRLVESYQDKTLSYLDLLNTLESDLATYLTARNIQIKQKVNESTYRILDLFNASNNDLNRSIDETNSEIEKIVSDATNQTESFKIKVEERKNFFRSKLIVLG